MKPLQKLIVTSLVLIPMLVLGPGAQAHSVATGGADKGPQSFSLVGEEIGVGGFQQIVGLAFVLPPGHTHSCVVTASSGVDNPFLGSGSSFQSFADVTFKLVLDDFIHPHNSDRVITFEHSLVDAVFTNIPERVEVSSTFFFRKLSAGFHGIRWMLRYGIKERTLHVQRSSLTVVCSKDELDPPRIILPPRP